MTHPHSIRICRCKIQFEEAKPFHTSHKRLSAFGMSWTWIDSPRNRHARRAVTNAFRLLVCLGRDAEKDRRADRRHKRLSAFGMSWTNAHVLRQLRRNRPSQTPFGFWYVLDTSPPPSISRRETGSHKRLSAFGMSWTTSYWMVSFNQSLRSQTPFGFWYVLD